MKTLLKSAFVTMALSLATQPVTAQDLEIRWGTEAGYKPYAFKTADGQLTGFDIEIGDAICAELKATCTWTEQDFDGLIPALQANKFDAILASLSITEKRKRVIDFTEKYYHVATMFIGKLDANLDDGEGLSGKTVGVQRATTIEDYLRGARPDINVKTYPTQDEVWLDLAAGRIDAGMVNKIVAMDGFIKTDRGVGFAIFGKEYFDPEYFGEGAGIAVRKSDTELRDAISGAIAALRANGKYKEINDKYFEFDIYGG